PRAETEDPPTNPASARGRDLTAQPQLRPAGSAFTTAPSRLLAVDGVEQVADPFVFPEGLDSEQAAPFLAADGDGFLISTTLDGSLSDDAEVTAEEQAADQLHALADAIGGAAAAPAA